MLSPSSLTLASLVPLGRFGALLYRERSRSAATLAELSRATENRRLPDRLLDIERGTVPLDDDEIAALCSAYAIESGPWQATGPCRLVLDRTASSDLSQPRRDGADGESSPAVVAERFLALAIMVGLDLTTERFGLDTLADTLELTAVDAFALLEERLVAGQDSLGAAVDSLRSKLTVPHVGLLVGDTLNGTLVLAPSPY
ncbi:MAG: hypothetical protein GX868_01735 [Actinobacteria bacterium]|nr:hypothetical protein [Actinomycetota bacterium]